MCSKKQTLSLKLQKITNFDNNNHNNIVPPQEMELKKLIEHENLNLQLKTTMNNTLTLNRRPDNKKKLQQKSLVTTNSQLLSRTQLLTC